MRVRGYVRYMDDMVLWHASREALVEVHARCQEFAATHLALDFKPSEVQRTGERSSVSRMPDLADPCGTESAQQASLATARAGPGARGATGIAFERVEPAAATDVSDSVCEGGRREELADFAILCYKNVAVDDP